MAQLSGADPGELAAGVYADPGAHLPVEPDPLATVGRALRLEAERTVADGRLEVGELAGLVRLARRFAELSGVPEKE